LINFGLLNLIHSKTPQEICPGKCMCNITYDLENVSVLRISVKSFDFSHNMLIHLKDFQF